jgi:hypothetical protein
MAKREMTCSLLEIPLQSYLWPVSPKVLDESSDVSKLYPVQSYSFAVAAREKYERRSLCSASRKLGSSETRHHKIQHCCRYDSGSSFAPQKDTQHSVHVFVYCKIFIQFLNNLFFKTCCVPYQAQNSTKIVV